MANRKKPVQKGKKKTTSLIGGIAGKGHEARATMTTDAQRATTADLEETKAPNKPAGLFGGIANALGVTDAVVGAGLALLAFWWFSKRS